MTHRQQMHFTGSRVTGSIPRELVSLIRRPAWMTDPRRRCAPKPGQLFNPLWTSEETSEETSDLNVAAGLCRRCPVRKECAQWATEQGERAWVWGGRRRSTPHSRTNKTAVAA